MACLLAMLSSAVATAAPSSASSNLDSASQINHVKNEIETLKSRKDLDEATQSHALDTYQKTLSALEAAQADRRQTDALRKAADNAPSEIDATQGQLRNLDQPPSLEALSSMPLERLSKRADDIRSQLTDAQARLSDLRDKLTRIAQQPEQLRQALAEARSKLQSLANDNASDIGNTNSIRSQAQSALASARREALNAEIERLQQALSGLDARERLLEAQRSLAEAQVARLNEALATAQTALSREQSASAQSLQSASEDKLSELRTALAPISQAAQKNVELTHQLAEFTQNTEALSQRQSDQRAQVDNLERRLNLVQRQLEIGGGSVALGDVLRNQRRRLASPSLSFLSSNTLSGLPDVSSAELDRFQLQQDRTELDNPDRLADRMADQAGVTLTAGQRESLVNLLQQRRAIVDQLIDAEGRYVDIGRELKALSQQYNDTLTSFNRLLDERLFWLPSFRGIWLDWPMRMVADLPWLIDPRSWRSALMAFVSGVTARPFIAGLSAFFITILIALRRPMRRQMRRLGEPVGNVSRDTIWLTLRVAVITVMLSLPSIVLPLIIGYLTGHAPGATRFARAVAAGIFQLGMLWLFIEPFATICRPYGLADRHFRWPASARRGLHRNLRWLLFALIIPIMVISMTEVFDDDAKRETLGRAAFMLGEVSIAIFAWRVLHPVTGALADVMTEDDGGHWRLGYLWLPVATAVPLALSGLAAMGYYYTALQLQTRFFYSSALLGGAVIFYSLIVRWLTVAERRLALARALRRREEAREARASREAAAVSGDSAPENLEALEIDLVQISEQTRGLIKVVITLVIGAGLWFVWSGTLPALQLLDNITLWQHTSRVDGQTTVTNVTLGALLLSVAVGVVTALAGRNLPGFLEITVLRRFSMDAGSRYAMATLFQYAIVILGLLVAVNLIGLKWSSIQWLVAAIGVGLGFGLQQIFANFISGILILFERPVRVGDTVTVGTLTGTVSRIRIRATTITDWDNKEVVIPNQTFITETVINWTLTDDITRLILRFCVALDSDGDLVERLINEAIDAEPVALETPAPSVFMVGYDDSAIIYEARVFYHDLYNLLPLQHALYRRVHGAFKANGIRIVYPQHDLHLRSVDQSVGSVFSHRDAHDNDDEARGQPDTPPGLPSS
ncbi:mechanosensitive ion channel domain-containing protein [Salinisphaera sp. Q1T1-3]|uniref:mechanosensitive ion channel domain-containing protein n=1 Tax=Salinisphaera sp. Q1T1-3 TaxID=2321229 RepID=UPI001314BB0B|nr:mechanosensitive ion channel domain-containing protein [Salinisphaera sp. Q1T1-3]